MFNIFPGAVHRNSHLCPVFSIGSRYLESPLVPNEPIYKPSSIILVTGMPVVISIPILSLVATVYTAMVSIQTYDTAYVDLANLTCFISREA